MSVTFSSKKSADNFYKIDLSKIATDEVQRVYVRTFQATVNHGYLQKSIKSMTCSVNFNVDTFFGLVIERVHTPGKTEYISPFTIDLQSNKKGNNFFGLLEDVMSDIMEKIKQEFVKNISFVDSTGVVIKLSQQTADKMSQLGMFTCSFIVDDINNSIELCLCLPSLYAIYVKLEIEYRDFTYTVEPPMVNQTLNTFYRDINLFPVSPDDILNLLFTNKVDNSLSLNSLIFLGSCLVFGLMKGTFKLFSYIGNTINICSNLNVPQSISTGDLTIPNANILETIPVIFDNESQLEEINYTPFYPKKVLCLGIPNVLILNIVLKSGGTFFDMIDTILIELVFEQVNNSKKLKKYRASITHSEPAE